MVAIRNPPSGRSGVRDYWGYSMKIDMSPRAVTNRLKAIDQLRKVCLSLANSSAGKTTREKFSANETVQRTSMRSAADGIVGRHKIAVSETVAARP
jgi:hypothetical protein